ncbi:hypothetical protein L6452_18957 [Arctium lappa]|uniref:Uncharacterized protein n=1 Tax=Arctium lappa TaxID=4217 RepID=A0ACB9BBP6_ARCLA|nr:hypothetical protein L6452_18957 [Arctium lappa]
MECRFMKTFKAMEDLENWAIANPDEGRMVGHYWLRNPKLSPNSFLRDSSPSPISPISFRSPSLPVPQFHFPHPLPFCLKKKSLSFSPFLICGSSHQIIHSFFSQDTRGKKRFSAELNRLEQETHFLEVA